MQMEVIGGIVGMTTLAVGLVGVAVKANEKIVLANNDNKHTQREVDELKVRVAKLEENIYQKLDSLQVSIEDIKVSIALLR